MSKTVEARVSISSDTRTAHIGRYFVDVRDTTGGADRQIGTKVTDNPAAYVADLTAAGLATGVFVELVDNTGE